MKTEYKDKHRLIKKMLKTLVEKQLGLANLINFYVETKSTHYTLYFSKPEHFNPTTTINGLHFYSKHIRGK